MYYIHVKNDKNNTKQEYKYSYCIHGRIYGIDITWKEDPGYSSKTVVFAIEGPTLYKLQNHQTHHTNQIIPKKY